MWSSLTSIMLAITNITGARITRIMLPIKQSCVAYKQDLVAHNQDHVVYNVVR